MQNFTLLFNYKVLLNDGVNVNTLSIIYEKKILLYSNKFKDIHL